MACIGLRRTSVVIHPAATLEFRERYHLIFPGGFRTRARHSGAGLERAASGAGAAFEIPARLMFFRVFEGLYVVQISSLGHCNKNNHEWLEQEMLCIMSTVHCETRQQTLICQRCCSACVMVRRHVVTALCQKIWHAEAQRGR